MSDLASPPRPTAPRWRTPVLIGLILLLCFTIGVMLQPTWLLSRLNRHAPQVIYSVPVDEPLIALTIDDGPHAVTTPRILDVLAENQATATFFLIAERVEGNEHLLQRMVQEGHELANHLVRDHPSILLTPKMFEEELLETHALLSGYAEVHWLRPGSGWYNGRMLNLIKEHDYRLALGSVYPWDAHLPFSSFARWFIRRRSQPGAIVVLHDYGGRGERTIETLSAVLPELRQRGYRIVSLSELWAARTVPNGQP